VENTNISTFFWEQGEVTFAQLVGHKYEKIPLYAKK
jgi:hypothetical protein